MKYLIFLAMISVPTLGHAAVEETTKTIEVLRSTVNCEGMTIDNTTPTDVVVSTNAAYTSVSVENEDPTSLIRCSQKSTVTLTGNTRGRRIVPGQEKVFLLAPGVRLYCITAGGSPTTAGVCKGG